MNTEEAVRILAEAVKRGEDPRTVAKEVDRAGAAPIFCTLPKKEWKVILTTVLGVRS